MTIKRDPQTNMLHVDSNDEDLLHELESYIKNGDIQKELRDNTAVKNLTNATAERTTSKTRIAEIAGKILKGKDGTVRCGIYTVAGKNLAEAPVSFDRKGKFSVSILVGVSAE